MLLRGCQIACAKRAGDLRRFPIIAARFAAGWCTCKKKQSEENACRSAPPAAEKLNNERNHKSASERDMLPFLGSRTYSRQRAAIKGAVESAIQQGFSAFTTCTNRRSSKLETQIDRDSCQGIDTKYDVREARPEILPPGPQRIRGALRTALSSAREEPQSRAHHHPQRRRRQSIRQRSDRERCRWRRVDRRLQTKRRLACSN